MTRKVLLNKSEKMEYMSQEGYDKLVAELRQLETVELPQVREAIAASAPLPMPSHSTQ